MIIPTELMGVYPKAAIEKKNRIMVDTCDYVITYINKDYGGAYEAARYAERRAKIMINITDFMEVNK